MSGGSPTWTALLLTGSRPGGDPLALRHRVASKAEIAIGGVPMAARVAAMLLQCPSIGRVIALGQDTESLRRLLPASPRLDVEASRSTIASTVGAWAGANGAQWPLIVTTADHVLLTSATLESFLDALCPGDDVGVGVVSKIVVRARFPANRRTWLRFRDGDYTGANLFALTGPAALSALGFWADVEQDRKKGWRLVAKLGPWLLVRALLRRVTLQGALEEAGLKLGVRVRAVALTDPLAAVDVDKEEDLVLATAVLEGRA